MAYLTLDLVVLGLDLLSLRGAYVICETEAESSSLRLKEICLWLDILLRMAKYRQIFEE